MAEVSITLAEVSMIFGRTVMADVSLGRSVNGPISLTFIRMSFGVFRVTRVSQFSRVYVIIVHYMIPPCRKQCYGHQQKEFC